MRAGTANSEADLALWREGRFVSLGFDRADAILLADEQVDWHQARELLERGCPHHFALLLLIPLPA
jgi:hypothetical protein